MNILLIGASGMIGSRILKEAASRGHKVIAAARSPEKIEKANGVETLALDVNDAKAIASAAEKTDVIISAVSPRNSGDAQKDAREFTEALIAAQKQTGKRLLMVGGGSTLQMPDGTSVLDLTPAGILDEATGMRRAYATMVTEDIDFVVLAPAGMINPGERTGKFRLGGRTMLAKEDGSKGIISAEDYAVAMIDEVETPKHFRTVFNVGY